MRLIICIALFAVVAAAAVAPLSEAEHESLFQAWSKEHGKTFGDDLFYRFEVFKANLQMIREHNAGNRTYTMGMNEFGHLTWKEFRSAMIGFGDVPQQAWATKTFNGDGVQSVDSIDWVAKGAVTAVKNQGQCGSCWSFSTTGSTEGALFIKTGKLVSLSEQNLVDCDTEVDQGCGGGLMDNAFAYMQKHNGLCAEADYPYTARQGSCKTSSCTKVSGTVPTAWVDVAHNEAAMEKALTIGPVSIAIEADQMGFQFYSGGVFSGNCGTNLDHGVLAVGFGVQPAGFFKSAMPFWKVKNSWGASWGEKGYLRIQKGKKQEGGQCGILLSASYPEL